MLFPFNSYPFSCICAGIRQHSHGLHGIAGHSTLIAPNSLRIGTNFRTIRPRVTVKQLAYWGSGARGRAREARQRAGWRHVTTHRLTLNQRVQGSSPWGLTTTPCGGR